MLKKKIVSNRWFILACAVFAVNLYAVLLYTVRGRAARDVKVALIIPDEERVAESRPVVFRFSSDMVEMDETGVWTHNAPVTFTPEVAGRYCWKSANELTFAPGEEWTTCTEYRATVDGALRSLDGRPLTDARLFDFSSHSLALVQAGQIDQGDRPRIRLHFNTPVAVDALRSHLDVQDGDGKSLPYELQRMSDATTADITLTDPDLSAANILISKGLEGTVGTLGLEENLAVEVTLSGDLLVSHIVPRTAGLQPGSVLVTFTSPIDLEKVTAFIRSDPKLDLTVEPYYSYGSGSRYVVRGAFAPGRSYTLTFAKGLPSARGSRLRTNETRVAYFANADPQMEIAAQGHYMTPQGNMLLPLKLLNVKECSLTIRRVFANNLVPLAARKEGRYRHYYGDDHAGLTRIVARDTRKFTFTPNKPIETAIALRPLIKDMRGAFHMEIVTEDGNCTEYHFIVSDTGLTARQSEDTLLVWANSLRDLTPVTGAEIRVLSLQNQTLASAKTDADGLARLQWAPDGETQPFIITAEKGEELTYLALDENRVTEPAATGSRPFLREGYEAYVFTDRGIYRPGGTCHIRTVVREGDLTCPASFPVSLTVYRPDGRRMTSMSQVLSDVGSAEFTVAWPDYAATGRYRLEVALPGEDGTILGHETVQVETFVPPRIEVAVTPRDSLLGDDGTYAFEVEASHLFGSPAAGLAVDADIEFAATPFKHAKWPNCVFGDGRRVFSSVRKKLGEGTLDAEGKALYKGAIPRGLRPPSALRATFAATVTEASGRTVTATAQSRMDVYPFYLGLKNPPSRLPTETPANIEVVAVTADGAPYSKATRLAVRLEKVTWTTVLRKNSDGRYRYISEEKVSPVAKETMGLSGGADTITITPSSPGRYRISLVEEDSGAAVSHEFYAAPETQAAMAWSMEKPDRVDLLPDKKTYLPGETARILIKAPFTGKALFTLETDTVREARVLVLTNNTCTVEVPISDACAPNAYCAISVIRPVVHEKTWGQHRAVGRVPLVVRQPQRQLAIHLNTATDMRPRSRLEATLAVRDHLGNAVEAEFTVAAVDEGICMLTDFDTPDPFGYFTAPRLPALTLSDLYASLMPELDEGLLGTASRPGGDDMGSMKRRLNPIKARRFNPVALWMGTTRTDSNGVGRITFDVPEFTGRLRLMAVAVNRDAFGHADTDVVVKRPLIVQSGLPRFLAPGDEAEMPVHLINESGKPGNVHLVVSCKGALGFADARAIHETTVAVAHGQPTNLVLRLKAADLPGIAHCTVTATMGDERFEETTELAVRPASALVTHTLTGTVKSGETEKIEFPSQWIAGTDETTLWLSPLPALKLAGGLDYLVRYPHGCLEQTTSQSFPLLYLADLAGEIYPGWLEQNAVKMRVQAGIDRVLSMQRPDGAFSLWPAGGPYTWGSIYATHFLTEASKAGYPVSEHAHRSALAHLERWLARGAQSARDGSTDLYNASYACLVLARAGRPQSGWMARIREQPRNLSRGTRVNTAAAYLAAGKRRDAAELLDGLVTMRPLQAKREQGGSLCSNERDDAILLATWIDAVPDSSLVPVLVQRLEKAQTGGRWYTTQDNAMALMALGKYCRMAAGKRKPIDANITWANGTKRESLKQRDRARIDMKDAATGEASLANTGEGVLYYYLKTSGIPPRDTAPEKDTGITVRRSFYDRDGEPLDPTRLSQGDLVVVGVELTSEDPVDNVVIEDLLPAGLEVENARLKTSKVLTWVQKRQTLPAAHVDSRDDRVVIFTSSFSGEKVLFYATRAVTRGHFVWPAIAAECMYDEALYSRHGRRELTVE